MPALGFEFSHREYSPAVQALQAPQAMGKGTTTRSPTRRFPTPLPSSTTSPMNSWPSTSPFSIVGMNPSYRCRSDPQIAVEVIRTIASRSLRIVGSGTSRTSTLVRPIQQFARIPLPFPSSPMALCRSGDGRCAARLPLTRRLHAFGTSLGTDPLTRLEKLLEPAHRVRQLPPRIGAGHGSDRFAQRATDRLLLEHRPDLDTAPARSGREGHS